MIVDTGVFVAAVDVDEADHDACVKLLESTPGTLVLPAMVVAEATFMIEHVGGSAAEASFLRSLRSRKYANEAPTPDDLARAAELVEEYADLPLGGTDASVIALAERLKDETIATLDRRHFSVVRPAQINAFTLLP